MKTLSIILACAFSYSFIGALCFRYLEKAHIGFDDYWYPKKNNVYSSLYGDHSAIWAAGGIAMSIFWPVTMPVLLLSRGMYRASKSVFEMLTQTGEDDDNE